MRTVLLALLFVSACQKSPTISQPAPEASRPSVAAAEPVDDHPLYKLQEQVQAKSGPEYLDELIERANTPESKSITLEKISQSPDFYYGHPWWFSGRLIHVKQNKRSGQHSIAIDGTNNIRIQVYADFPIDFVPQEEVDVVGYLTDTGQYPGSHSMLAHSILKKGTVAERLKKLSRQ